MREEDDGRKQGPREADEESPNTREWADARRKTDTFMWCVKEGQFFESFASFACGIIDLR